MDEIWETLAEMRNVLVSHPIGTDDHQRILRLLKAFLDEAKAAGTWEAHHSHVSKLIGLTNRMTEFSNSIRKLINQLSDQLHKLPSDDDPKN